VTHVPKEPVVLRVDDSGEAIQVTDGAANSHMKPDQVLIIIDDDGHRIWIWKGEEAPVRRKFIAARRASGIRDERGLAYRIISEDHGHEDKEFLDTAGQPLSKKPDKAGMVSVEAPTRPPPGPLQKEAKPEPRVSMPSTGEARPDYTRVVVSATRTPERPSVQAPRPPSDIIEAVERLEPVPGYRREFVLIGFDAFALAEETTSVLGKKTVTRRLQRLDSLPEGTIFAQGYIPRVVIQNGQVLAIEFLKQLEEEEYQHEKPGVKEAMKRHLDELVQGSKGGSTKQGG